MPHPEKQAPQLSVSQLHAEYHRLLNSIYHLRRSNATLLSEAFASDPDCREAVRENEEVITRQQQRADLAREELARRGFPLTHGEERELEQREERRERLGGTAEVEDGLVDGADHLPESGGGVESGRLGSGEVGSSGPGTFVGNIAIQDSFIAAATNEVGVVVHPAPVAEGVQGDGSAARLQELPIMPSTSAQTDRVNADGVNGI